MKRDSNLKIQLNNGYYDLATPYFSAVYELRHLPIPAALQTNIETHFYRSGHMIYTNESELKLLRGNIAAFIGRTASVGRAFAWRRPAARPPDRAAERPSGRAITFR